MTRKSGLFQRVEGFHVPGSPIYLDYGISLEHLQDSSMFIGMFLNYAIVGSLGRFRMHLQK